METSLSVPTNTRCSICTHPLHSGACQMPDRFGVCGCTTPHARREASWRKALRSQSVR
jgi:hypothetical protein